MHCPASSSLSTPSEPEPRKTLGQCRLTPLITLPDKGYHETPHPTIRKGHHSPFCSGSASGYSGRTHLHIYTYTVYLDSSRHLPTYVACYSTAQIPKHPYIIRVICNAIIKFYPLYMSAGMFVGRLSLPFCDCVAPHTVTKIGMMPCPTPPQPELTATQADFLIFIRASLYNVPSSHGNLCLVLVI